MKYWCSYCGEPLSEDDKLKAWRFRSPRGGSSFIARMFQCKNCGKKIRVTEKERETEISLLEQKELRGY